MRRGLWRLVVRAATKRADAGEAVSDVKRVGDLAKFAVADAIDAGRNLSPDDLVNSRCETGIECRLFDRPTRLSCFEKAEKIGWPRQAADMGRQNPFRA